MIATITTILKLRKWGSEMLNNSSKITQQMLRGSGIHDLTYLAPGLLRSHADLADTYSNHESCAVLGTEDRLKVVWLGSETWVEVYGSESNTI